MASLTRRRTFVKGGLLLATTMGGCLSPSEGGRTLTSTRTATRTAPTTSTSSPIPSERVTTYDALSERGKDLFRRLIDQDSVERPSNEIPSTLWDAEYVRYEGVVYEITKTDTGRDVVKTHLSVEQVTETAVSETEVITYEDLTPAAKNAFEESLSNDTYTVDGEDLPKQLQENEFVSYRSDYYRLRVMVEDIRVWSLSVSKVGDE